MRVLLVPALVAASLALTPMAFAATQNATGTIKSIDAKTHTLILADGSSYVLPANFKAENFKPGQKVHVSWVMKDHMYDATSVKLVK
jgi:Ni/Co efflux regulator RcnB